MLVLLPPSETKRTGGEEPFDPAALHGARELGDARIRVRDALLELSRGDEDAAAKALKLGKRNRGELEHNLRLGGDADAGLKEHRDAIAMPAIRRYTGVLYDALDVSSLDADALGWLNEHVLVQSALFGLVSAGDPIPVYRLSAGSRLPALGAPLKRVWGDAHAGLDWEDVGLILDLRSKDYGALAPLPTDRGRFLHVVQRGEDGEMRALNHFNKAAKGDLVRRLARSGARIDTIEELVGWAESAGLEMSFDAPTGRLVLITRLGAPASDASGSPLPQGATAAAGAAAAV